MTDREVRRWSVDFGNVLIENFSKQAQAAVAEICARKDFLKNSQTLEEFLLKNSRLLPDAMRGLKRLVDRNGAENVFIVSRVDKEAVEINRVLFGVNKICELTGLLEANIYFVEMYSDKVDVCERLKIKNHIDDRGEVLSYMCGRLPHLIWFAPTKEDIEKWSVALGSNVVRVRNWEELIPILDWM